MCVRKKNREKISTKENARNDGQVKRDLLEPRRRYSCYSKPRGKERQTALYRKEQENETLFS